jgi:hypothetical protein
MTNTEYIRIQAYLRGRFRPLQGPDDPAYAQLGSLPSGPTLEEFIAASPLPEVVNKFLTQLDLKVDALLAGMVSSSLEDDFPHTMEILNVGASGMEFITTKPLAPGDFLEVILYFRRGGARLRPPVSARLRNGASRKTEPPFFLSRSPASWKKNAKKSSSSCSGKRDPTA